MEKLLSGQVSKQPLDLGDDLGTEGRVAVPVATEDHAREKEVEEHRPPANHDAIATRYEHWKRPQPQLKKNRNASYEEWKKVPPSRPAKTFQEYRRDVTFYDGTTKVSAKQIADSIPEEASCVFHILDRRINLDAFDKDASFYSLMRAWVQDDPYRYTPPVGSNLLEFLPLSSQRRLQDHEPPQEGADNEKSEGASLWDSNTSASGGSRGTVDVLANLKNTKANPPSMLTLTTNHLYRANNLRRKRAIAYRKRKEHALKRLKSLGIEISSRTTSHSCIGHAVPCG